MSDPIDSQLYYRITDLPVAQPITGDEKIEAVQDGKNVQFTLDQLLVAGDSAYDVAVQNGFVGTEAQWLLSLKGDATLSAALANPAEGGSLVKYQYPTLHGVQTDMSYLMSERATAKKLGLRFDGRDITDALRNAFEDLQGGVLEISEFGLGQISEEVILKYPISIFGPGGGFQGRDNDIAPIGCCLKLADGANLGANGAILRVVYQGDPTGPGAFSRLPVRLKNFGIFGNKMNAIAGNGLVLEAARYAVVEDVIIYHCPGDGLRGRTGGTANVQVNNHTMTRVHSIYNTGDGFDFAGDDGSIVQCIAGANGGDGFILYGGKVYLGCLAWNNGRFGFRMENFTDTDLTGCAAYDNNSAGFSISNANMIGLNGCTGMRNGQNEATATLSAGVVVSNASKGIHISGFRSGNKYNSNAAQSQKYGIAIVDTDSEVSYDFPSYPSNGVAGTDMKDLVSPVYDISTNSGSRLSRFKVGSNGNEIKNIWTATRSWDPGSLADGATSPAVTLTISGATIGDPVMAGFSSITAPGWLLDAHVTAANTVSVTLTNKTGAAADLPNGTLRVTVMHH